MSVRLSELLLGDFERLRHEPVRKRVRAMLGDRAVVDSVRAALVYEPRRVVPSYAVPAEDVDATLVATATARPDAVPAGHVLDHPALRGLGVLDPSIPFDVHTADGQAVDVVAGGVTRAGAGFRLEDADLPGYVVLDFDAFDAWFDEEEPLVAHPRDPFHSMEILRSSREVRVELDGVVLAVSRRARLLLEGTVLPPRAYLPREDVLVELRPSARRSCCAYKGEARYWTVGPHTDLAWTYDTPLREAAEVAGLVAFFDERVDVTLDGEPQPRPVTPWS